MARVLAAVFFADVFPQAVVGLSLNSARDALDTLTIVTVDRSATTRVMADQDMLAASDRMVAQMKADLLADQQANSTQGNMSSNVLDGTLQLQSCSVWADPHVSGFDNTDNIGPSAWALLAEGHNVSRVSHNTSIASNASRGNASFNGEFVAEGGGEVTNGVSTFDKRPMDVNAYDAGDFWLVKSKHVHIQGRFRLSGEFKPDRAAIGSVAVGGPFLHGHQFIVSALDGKIMFDKKSAPKGEWERLEAKAGPTIIQMIQEEPNVIQVKLSGDIGLLFRRFDKHVDIKITMPPQEGGIDGECGNYDGVAENDDEPNIAARMGSIMIAEKDSLFLPEEVHHSRILDLRRTFGMRSSAHSIRGCLAMLFVLPLLAFL